MPWVQGRPSSCIVHREPLLTLSHPYMHVGKWQEQEEWQRVRKMEVSHACTTRNVHLQSLGMHVQFQQQHC